MKSEQASMACENNELTQGMQKRDCRWFIRILTTQQRGILHRIRLQFNELHSIMFDSRQPISPYLVQVKGLVPRSPVDVCIRPLDHIVQPVFWQCFQTFGRFVLLLESLWNITRTTIITTICDIHIFCLSLFQALYLGLFSRGDYLFHQDNTTPPWHTGDMELVPGVLAIFPDI